MRVLEAAMAQRWAMLEPWVRTVLDIAAGENETVQAVEARLGRKLDNTQTTTIRDGVALLPVRGPIFPRANLFTEVSGATSVQVLARDFTAALENPMVRSIILDVDSPGGSVNGIHEFGEMVHAARGRKPIVAYVGALGASAAYWIASAADEIVLDATAGVGSIGVVAILPDPSKKQTKELEIVSSQSPKKRVDVSTEAGRSHIQAEVDHLAGIFIDRVARNRGMTPDDVMRAEGAVKSADEAIALGLADRMGSLEGLIAEMAQPSGYKSPRRAAQEKRMAEQPFWSRIGAALGFGNDEQKAETTADEVIAAAEAQAQELAEAKAKLERLEADLAARDEARAIDEERIEEERNARIDAEVAATVKQFETRFGKAGEEAFASLLRGVKAASADGLEASLLAFVENLPVIGASERVIPAAVDVEEVAAKAAGTLDPNAALNASIEATVDAKGFRRGTPEWGREFSAEFDRIRRAAQ